MKALAMVAHPDDCVIFAYSYIYNHPQHDWTICYLTYNETLPRGSEVMKFWQKRSIATIFLGFVDQWDTLQERPSLIELASATQAIKQVIDNYDLVLTHNENGEYGHPHHRLVHQATKSHDRIITFAGPGLGTCIYEVPKSAYDLEELPLHRDVIAQFHKYHHRNEYT